MLKPSRSWNRILLLLFCMSMAAGGFSAEENRLPSPGASLNDTLARVRISVGTFWDHFRSVACVEKVTQEKLGKKGKVEHRTRSTFDYLVLLALEKDGISVDESRLQQGKKKGKVKNTPLLVTSGIPTLLLVFHPYYRNSFEYELNGQETAGGRMLARIRFRHIPGTRSTAALRLRGKDYPLGIQGVAWVDPATGAVHRIAAELAAPMTDINLKSLQMEVSYEPRRFPSGEGEYWLPSTAAINIRTERQHWRNLHQYSNYKKFTVNTEDTVSR